MIKPNDESTWIEEIRYQVCITAFNVYVEYERYRLTQSALELARNDFWIQLVLGLTRCGVIPSPVQGTAGNDNKVQPTSEFYGQKMSRVLNSFKEFV